MFGALIEDLQASLYYISYSSLSFYFFLFSIREWIIRRRWGFIINCKYYPPYLGPIPACLLVWCPILLLFFIFVSLIVFLSFFFFFFLRFYVGSHDLQWKSRYDHNSPKCMLKYLCDAALIIHFYVNIKIYFRSQWQVPPAIIGRHTRGPMHQH